MEQRRADASVGGTSNTSNMRSNGEAMIAPTPELTRSDLEFLERIVADRVHKEKAKQRWGRVPKKYDDLRRKLNQMLGKELGQ